MEEGITGRYDCDRLKKEIFDKIDYFSREYQLTYVDVIGVLEIVKQVMIKESGSING